MFYNELRACEYINQDDLSRTNLNCLPLFQTTVKKKMNPMFSLCQDGGLFTFGDGSWGQLGHGSTNNELLPRRVLELMGTEVSQITCGRYCLFSAC